MFTPQQLEQIQFKTAVFGGYEMESVDAVLEPLLEDYEALYKENATLKSKMRVLVEKLEEYRQNEGSAKEALQAAQATCDDMIRQTEVRCQAMAAGSATLAAAKATAREGIASMEQILKEMLEKLQTLKEEAAEAPKGADSQSEADVAKEIAESLEKLVGTTEDAAPVAPRPGRVDASATNRFTNLQFGKNYDVKKRK